MRHILFSQIVILLAYFSRIGVVASSCNCEWTGEYVCGLDGYTYSSQCKAQCFGIEIAYAGICTILNDDCNCTDVVEIICGTDSITYINPCFVSCNGTTQAHTGACNDVVDDLPPSTAIVAPYNAAVASQCDCDLEGPTVCASDGITYENSCHAQCRNANIVYVGNCLPPKNIYEIPCTCVKKGNPVCGGDGLTYTNLCMAHCNNTAVLYPGECIENLPFYDDGNSTDFLTLGEEAEEKVASEICVLEVENLLVKK